MDEKEKERLKAAGIDINVLLERFMGNGALAKKFLKKFSEDKNFKALQEAFKQGDGDAAFTAAHTLKGLTGNLSMSALFSTISSQVELLRGGEMEKAAQMMPEIEEEYHRIAGELNQILE